MTMQKVTVLPPINLKFGDVAVINLSFQNIDGNIEKRPALAVVLFYDNRNDMVSCSLIFHRLNNYRPVPYDHVISTKGTGINHNVRPILSISSLVLVNANDIEKIGELTLEDKETSLKLLEAMNMSCMSNLVHCAGQGHEEEINELNRVVFESLEDCGLSTYKILDLYTKLKTDYMCKSHIYDFEKESVNNYCS